MQEFSASPEDEDDLLDLPLHAILEDSDVVMRTPKKNRTKGDIVSLSTQQNNREDCPGDKSVVPQSVSKHPLAGPCSLAIGRRYDLNRRDSFVYRPPVVQTEEYQRVIAKAREEMVTLL